MTITGAPYLVEWNADSQQLAIDRVNDDPSTGTSEVAPRQDFGGGRLFLAALEPFYVNSSTKLGLLLYFDSLAYNVDPNTIFMAYVQNPATSRWYFDRRGSTNWSSGWRSIKPFYLNNSTYLFFYKAPVLSLNGIAAIDKVADNGDGSTEIWRAENWAKDWNVFEPFYITGNAYLLECKTRNSAIAIDKINDDARGTTELWRGGGLDVNQDLVKVFYNGRLPYVLSYDSTSGNYAVHAIRYEQLNGLTPLSTGSWIVGGVPPRVNWQRITPFYLNGTAYFFACNYAVDLINPTVSIVGIARFDPDSNTLTQIWSGEWKAGWTEVQSIYLPPSPYPPVVPAPPG